MNRLLPLLILLIACGKDPAPPLPACKPFSDDDLKDQIKSKEIGSVVIDGETCRIFEQYQSWGCTVINGEYNYIDSQKCVGRDYYCQYKTLTRITKCPSSTHTNGVTRTGGKFSHEEVH